MAFRLDRRKNTESKTKPARVDFFPWAGFIQSKAYDETMESRQRNEGVYMFTPTSIIEGKEISNVQADFKSAERVEQYRVSRSALYLPEGLRWKYIPISEIQKIEESFRVISAGHCVPVREKRPEIDISIPGQTVHLQLEKQESMQKIMEVFKK